MIANYITRDIPVMGLDVQSDGIYAAVSYKCRTPDEAARLQTAIDEAVKAWSEKNADENSK